MSDSYEGFSRSANGVWQPSIDVKANIPVVAGDIAGCLSTMGWDWLENQRRRLDIPIVVVAGNRNFWTASLDREIPGARACLQVDGIHILDSDAVKIGDVRFVGGTLWTDYAICRDGTHKGQFKAQASMNEFKYTRLGVGVVRSRLTLPAPRWHLRQG